MFSITPDRHSIHRDEDSTVSERTETKRGARWNRWIFEELVVHAWTANLQFISDLTLQKECPESFSGWNVWPLGGKEQGTLGVGLLEAVFERIVACGLKLLPTIRGSLAHPSEVIFAPQLDDSLEAALREAGVVVMYPPSDRREQLCRVSRLRDLSPKEIRLALTVLQLAVEPVDSDGLEAISDSSRSMLLDYVLSDGLYDIGECKARLLPMLDGTFRSFFPMLPKNRFAQSEEQLKLFEKCEAFMVDNSKLSSATLHHFTTRLDLLEQFTSLSPWDMEGARWYCCNWIFGGERSSDYGDSIYLPKGIEIEWVDRFWTWAISHNRMEAMSAFEGLWLLPLTGNRYQALPPSIPILDVSGHGQVASLFREILASCPTAVSKYPLYTVDEMISRTNTEFFREANFIMDSEEIKCIVAWLALFPEFLDVASDAQRTRLVGILGELAVKRISKDTKAEVRSSLSRLPLFHYAFDRGYVVTKLPG
jgi:sacsin